MCARSQENAETFESTLPFPLPPRVGRTPSKSDIFRAMIAWEISEGPLHAARRKRLVRYAAQLGLSATQAGEVIRSCVGSSGSTTRRVPLAYVPSQEGETGEGEEEVGGDRSMARHRTIALVLMLAGMAALAMPWLVH